MINKKLCQMVWQQHLPKHSYL